MAFTLPTEFQASLLPASYNGIFFYVVDTGIKSGQRVALHEFPMRDVPLAEPMGKATRNFTFSAFLVGDAPSLQSQYAALLNAVERSGAGTLVHPVFGQQQVVCVMAEFEQHTAGRYVEIRFQFVEAGQVIFPSTGMDTQANTIKIADQAMTTNSASVSAQVSSEPLPDTTPANPSPGSSTPAQTTFNDFGDTHATTPFA